MVATIKNKNTYNSSNFNPVNTKIILFYENSEISNRITRNISKNLQKYPIKELSKLKDIFADFLIIETQNQNIHDLINQIEIISTTPYIIITKTSSKQHHSLHLLDIISYNEINNIRNKINDYFDKLKQDEFSVFELTDVMQMISMEKKTIAIRVIAENKVGALAFKDGLPVYAKAIINGKVEYGIKGAFKIISWDNIKFKIVKIIGKIPVNLDINLPNLLMGAMQYKDEFDYSTESSKKNIIPQINKNSELNCQNITTILNKISGYIGISIFKNNKLLCKEHSRNSHLKNKDLKTHINKITLLVKTMLNDMGFQKFDNILLATETGSAIIYHDEEDRVDIILFLEKNSNMALSKVIIKKIMLETKIA